jgi:cAMP-dependent protein kinase regulator
MFNALDKKDLEIVINAMDLALCKQGTVVINQGDDGDNLYIVEAGQLSCHRKSVSLELSSDIAF